MEYYRRNEKGLWIVYVTVLIDSMGFGVILPVLPRVIMALADVDISMAATFGGVLLFLYAAMQFLFSPVLGRLSDCFGRRPVMLLSLFVFSVSYLLMGLASSILWLIVGRAIAGMAGATISVANAYVVDMCHVENRVEKIGQISAAWGLGIVIGPVVGGLVSDFGFRVPFFLAAILAFTNLIIAIFLLPETLTKDERRPFTIKRANPLSTFLKFSNNIDIVYFLFIFFLLAVAYDTHISVFGYFSMEKFTWTETEIGYALSFVGIMLVIIQGLLIKIAMPLLGAVRLAVFGMIFNIIGLLGIAFCTDGWMLYLWAVPFCIGCLCIPAIRGMMVEYVPKNEQGELQGAIASVNSFSIAISPLIMTQMFHTFSEQGMFPYFPGAPYVTAASCIGVALLLFSRTLIVKQGEVVS